MEIYTEHHKTKKTLFKRVDEILRENGFYSIDTEDKGYLLRYWFCENSENVYMVVKGKSNMPFKFWIGPECNEQEINLEQGATLIFDVELKDDQRVWFYCPQLLLGKRAMEIENAFGFVKDCSLSQLLQDALIKKFTTDQSAEEITALQETSSERNIIPDADDSKNPIDLPIHLPEPESVVFETIRNTLDILKDTIGNITNVKNYTSSEKVEGVRTLKISECSYPSTRGPYHSVAHIRLAGRWLERAGFMRGDFVQVITIKGLLVVVSAQSPSTLFIPE